MRQLPAVAALLPAVVVTTLILTGDPHGAAAADFRPVFLALRAAEPIAAVGVKCEHPIYNLTGWKRADGRVVHDVFDIGDVIVLDRPTVTAAEGVTRWRFTHGDIDIEARLRGGRLRYSFTAHTPGRWSVAYAGAPAAELDDVIELFQPLIWNGRRLPEASFLIPDDICSIPGCLVQTNLGTVGVMADPRQFPFEMPNGRNRRFGVTVRNRDGLAQPLVFTPFPASPESALAGGDSRSYELVLVDDARPLAATFEAVARDTCGFQDRRENTLVSLNRAFENIVDFATSAAGRFDPANRAFSYPDSAGTVKNVSSLHPITLAFVTDDERLFRDQGVPILEYLLSREKFLFALSDEAKSSQTPSRLLAGPAMPVSELAALHRLTHGANPCLLACAERLSRVDRTLNMEWVSPAHSWQSDLWLYRATGAPARLDAARTKGGKAIAARIDRQPTDFVESGTGTFFDSMLPPWKEFYELWLDTRDPRHLAAAHKAARQYAQMVWFYPAVPEGNVVVNDSGFAPRRARPGEPGLVPAPRETVPAWRVSEQGLICEGNGTVGRLAIYLATHAPLFMRLSHDADDPFLRDIARSAIVGRFAGFPGYHFNTSYSTAQEKADFALRPFDEIRHTTSMHFNHSLPMAALVLDYLFSEAYARSRGAIDFPAEFAEGYAYLGGRVYAAPGTFYDQENVRPWMPKGLVTADSVQVNYIAGRGEAALCIALMNQCGRPLDDVALRIDLARFAAPSGTVVAEIWQDGVKSPAAVPVTAGEVRVSMAPHGLTALVIKGLVPAPTFQEKFREPREDVQRTNDVTAVMPHGSAHALRLSFGEQLTWVYAYLECRPGDVTRVRFAIDHAGTVTHHTDDSYPFECSIPHISRTQPVRVRFEVESTGEAVDRSDFIQLGAAGNLLDRAIADQQLIRSNGRLADVRDKGPNPYREGFPAPQPFHEHYAIPLVRNAHGLLVNAESEYDRAESEVVRFLSSNFIPAIRKTMQLDESVIGSVRVAARPSREDLVVRENLTYNVLGERALVLDLHTPKMPTVSRLPVVLFVHGGGWLDGSHRTNRPVAMSLAARGFACIAVEYRLGREARFPAAVWDVKAAVRWVRKMPRDSDSIPIASSWPVVPPAATSRAWSAPPMVTSDSREMVSIAMCRAMCMA